MFTVIQKITITQVSTSQYPDRDKIFVFDFVNTIEISSTWSHLTDTMRIVLPRKIYFLDESTNTKLTWDDVQVYGNPEKAPILLRGDKIDVEFGYSYYKNKSVTDFDRSNIIDNSVNRFSGYITKINNRMPIELECEDNMYALKQTLVPNKEWNTSSTYTMEMMLKDMMSGSSFNDVANFTIKTDNYKHNISKFITYNVTMAQVLDQLRRYYHLESFFRGNELHCGVIRYYPEERQNHIFNFQKNIISDNMVYMRDDDIRIGIVAKSINKIELVETNSAGKKKTRHKELKVTVGDKDGELRTLFFTDIDSEAELKKQAEAKLPFLKYEGFRGSFTTFALPAVKHGDTVQLVDEIVTERNGTYLVKEVKPICGVGGGRQIITLDIRVDGLSHDQLLKFQENGL